MPDERYSTWFQIVVDEMSKDFFDEIFCEFFEPAESVTSIPLRHEKMNVRSRKTEVQVSFYKTQISFVSCKINDAEKRLYGRWVKKGGVATFQWQIDLPIAEQSSPSRPWTQTTR